MDCRVKPGNDGEGLEPRPCASSRRRKITGGAGLTRDRPHAKVISGIAAICLNCQGINRKVRIKSAAGRASKNVTGTKQMRNLMKTTVALAAAGHERAGLCRLGADQTGRDRGRGGRRRRLRPDGADDAGRDPEEQSDEAADGGVAEGRSVRRRSADVHEIQRRRRQQGADRLFADLHAAAVGENSVQLARTDAGVGGGARPVRAVGQCRRVRRR